MKKLICFDLDGTLTQHRTKLDDKNRSVLERLSKKYKLLMVGAGTARRIYDQLGQFPIDVLGNFGMEDARIIDGKFTMVREDKAYPDREYFNKVIGMLRKKYGHDDYKGESVEFHPCGMVTVPLLGTKADIKDKLVFDPDRKKRRLMYEEIKSYFPEYAVYIGGSSSFDFIDAKYNKYLATMRYAEEHGIKKQEILFVGDDFEDGGGDSHVRLGGMDYVNITHYTELESKLEYLF